MTKSTLYDCKKEEAKIGKKILVSSFGKDGEIIDVYGKVIALYKWHCLVKTKHYLTSINFS